MQKIIFFLYLFTNLYSTNVFSQTVSDYKVKTQSNIVDRTKILDILRAKLYEDYRQEFVFAVNKLNVSNGYAWFEGNAQRKDGGQVKVHQGDDCCHVESLLKKSGGKWYIVEMGAFSTDMWWDGLWNRTKAPKKIFF